MQLAVKMGLHLCIITGARVEEVRKRYEGLGIKDVYIASSIKVNDFEHFVEKYNLKPNEILYMGDDIPDWQVMSRCGLPCCPADACPEIQSLCKYVSPYNGGEGCVRDVLEHVLKVQGKWMKDEHAFGW
jgi:3-deoxy-D-manno-octulosonate 8-phosphate phosphatase (KDO 8-P phosphatase)